MIVPPSKPTWKDDCSYDDTHEQRLSQGLYTFQIHPG